MAVVHSASQMHAAVQEWLAIKVCVLVYLFVVLYGVFFCRIDGVLHQSSQLIFERVRKGWKEVMLVMPRPVK